MLAAKLPTRQRPQCGRWNESCFPSLIGNRAREADVVVRADAAFALPASMRHWNGEGEVRDPTPGQQRAGAAHRGSAHSAPRPTEPRAAGSLSEFRVSSRLMEPTSTVIAKVEHHLGELFPRVGFIVTTLTERTGRRPFYNQRGTAEAVDQGRQGSHPLDSLSCHRSGPPRCVASRRHATTWQSAAPVVLPSLSRAGR